MKCHGSLSALQQVTINLPKNIFRISQFMYLLFYVIISGIPLLYQHLLELKIPF